MARNGYTRIPNDIMSQPWANNPNAMYLYTWLSLNADKDGQIRTSRADLSERTGLSERQLRTAIEKLEATKYVTKQTTKQPTKLATVLTISYLASCKSKKSASDQVSDQASDQVSDQPRAYKNDNYNIMSIEDYKETINSPNVELIKEKTDFEKFCDWLNAECPYIASHYRLPTEETFHKLKADYGSQAILEECLNLENSKVYRTKYVILSRTLINWIKRRKNEDTKSGNSTAEKRRDDAAAIIARRLAEDDAARKARQP